MARRFPEDTAPLAVWVEDRGHISARIVDPEDGRLCDPEQFSNFAGFQKTPIGDAGRLYEKLRVWRYDAGQQVGRPLYRIASLQALRAIAETRPATYAGLHAAGMLEEQVERCGDALLELISETPLRRAGGSATRES